MKKSGAIQLTEHIRIRFYQYEDEHLCQLWCDNRALCIEFDNAQEGIELAEEVNTLFTKWLAKKKKQNVKRSKQHAID